MSAERVIANLLRIAREDLEGARMLNARGNRNAIYLCEQAAEKIIRAVLTSEKIHAGAVRRRGAAMSPAPSPRTEVLRVPIGCGGHHVGDLLVRPGTDDERLARAVGQRARSRRVPGSAPPSPLAGMHRLALAIRAAAAAANFGGA